MGGVKTPPRPEIVYNNVTFLPCVHLMIEACIPGAMHLYVHFYGENSSNEQTP